MINYRRFHTVVLTTLLLSHSGQLTLEADTAVPVQGWLNWRGPVLPSASSDTIQPEVLWSTNPKNERYYASPVFHQGLIYAITEHGHFSVIDAKTGAILHQRKLNLGSTVFSSVTLAGDLLYITGQNGTTIILETGREAKEIAKNQLGQLKSSPVFVGDRMYLRTRNNLYCIGQP